MSSKGENAKDVTAEGDGKNEVKEDTKDLNKEATDNGEESITDKADTDKVDVNDQKSKEDVKTEDEEKDTDNTDDDSKTDEPAKADKKQAASEKKLDKANDVNRKKGKKEAEEPVEVKDSSKVEIPQGKGTPLGEIPRVDASISRFKNDDLKLLHQLLFVVPGKTAMIKKNIKRFNGFAFTKDSAEYNKKVSSAKNFELKQLKIVCEMLDLEKKGSKDEIAERVVEFLIDPKDSGKVDGGGRPKRTAAVRAKNRGYSSHDDSYSSDEKPSLRGRRDKGRRSNLKDESSSESDEEFRLSDESDEKPKRKRRGPGRRKRSEDEDSNAEDSLESSEDSDVEQKSKRAKPTPKPKGKRGRGRPPTNTSAKKKPAKRRGKKQSTEEEEEEEEEESIEEGDSSEDEPLIKKAKSQDPPTDEEIKSYVKDILEGANLEEITMKTVCKQVYAHYPDFDLTHKKDYIKTTVKSLIST